MGSAHKGVLAGGVVVAFLVAVTPSSLSGPLLGAARVTPDEMTQRIDLLERLAAGKLRAVGKEVTKAEGREDGVHLAKEVGDGIAWLEGTDFADGTIEIDVRGRDVFQQSFVGIAFHRKDDKTYDVVYLRPFNFRTDDPVRRQHAVQYMASPDYEWPRLRKEFPEEFENPVDASIAPTDWVPLRVDVKGGAIRIYVGTATSPTLEVRKLGQHDRGMIGLWTGNNSDGAFSNLRVTHAK